MYKTNIALGLLCMLVFNTLAAFGQADWKRIVVMKSTQEDVENILGKPRTDLSSDDISAFFLVKTGRISVKYSTGLCEPDQRGGWNIDKGIVDEIAFSPAFKLLFKSLKIDRKKYQKTFEGDTDALSYINNEEGIEYIVLNGKVRHIVYFPGSKYESLQCQVINDLK